MKKFLMINVFIIGSLISLKADVLKGASNYGSIDCNADFSSSISFCCQPLRYQCQNKGGKVKGECKAVLRDGSYSHNCNIDCELECKGMNGSIISLTNQISNGISLDPKTSTMAPVNNKGK